MFTFDPSLVSTHQALSSKPDSSVYPYQDSQHGRKCAVKCINVDSPQKLNVILQNILVVSTSNSSCLVPIQGYDIQKENQGRSKVYIKMPIFPNSLMKVMQQYQANMIPKDKIVHYFYSIASALDNLAMKGIYHRNLKPTNILIDEDDHLYLSDLSPVQSKENATTDGGQTRQDDNDQYMAPEMYFPDWPHNQEDAHRADAWALGVIMTKACLLDKFIPVSLELPMEDIRQIIEDNLAEVGRRYGKDMTKTLRGLMSLEAKQRENFSTVIRMLEQNSAGTPEVGPKEITLGFDNEKQNVGKQAQVSRNLEDVQESPILGESVAHTDRNELIDDWDGSLIEWHGSSKVYRITKNQIYQKLRTAKDYITSKIRSIRKPRPNSVAIIRERIHQRVRSLRENARSHLRSVRRSRANRKKLACLTWFLIIPLIFVAYLMFSHFSEASKKAEHDQKYINAMRALAIRNGDFFEIGSEEPGVLSIQIKTNTISDQNTQQNFDDSHLITLMEDLRTSIEPDYIKHHIVDFRFKFFNPVEITELSFRYLLHTLTQFQSLKRLALQDMNGNISNEDFQFFILYLADNLPNLEGLTIAYPLNYYARLHFTSDTAQDFGYLLSKLEKLKSLYLTIDRTDIDDGGLEALGNVFIGYGNKLESLALGISSDRNPSRVAVKSFNAIFLHGMPNLKELHYLASNTPMSDEEMCALTDSLTLDGKQLKILKIYAGKTSITDYSINYLGTRLSEVKLENIEQLVLVVPEERISYAAKLQLVRSLDYVPDLHLDYEV